MKSIKLFLVVVLLATSTILASNTNPTDEKKAINISIAEVHELLKNPNFKIEKDITVLVKFTVNRNNEMVVLQVESKNMNSTVEGYIKSRLNYKKLSKKIKTAIYTLPIKLVRFK